jgi:phosphoglycolate phosphatase
VDPERLKDEIRTVHRRHRTSEYAFLIDEVPSLVRAAGGEPPVEYYADAIAEFRRVRREKLHLYAGVLEFLGRLRERGVTIIAYTESLAFYTEYRFRKLGLDTVVDYLYSPADHDLPAGMAAETVRHYPPEHYRLAVTQHRNTPPGELKPNPAVLSDILRDVGAEPEQAVYVGDSLLKDVWMAQEAGVLDAYAAYGAAQHQEAYELLRRVTHWRDEDVERERATIRPGVIAPTITLERLDQLENYVQFVPFSRRAA